MKLPNASNATVEREKIVDYLLNTEHPIGASKAHFFTHFGFSVDKWKSLADALLAHGQTGTVAQTRQTKHGPRYEVEGRLQTPAGRTPFIRSVWQLDDGAVAPRLITAYPLDAQ